MQQQKAFIRLHQSWLAGPERALLNRMAKNLPAWIIPDHLTILGVAGSLLCGIAFAWSGVSPVVLWFAVIGLVLNWVGDSLDGSLARIRNIERPQYGFFVDHTSDIISQTLIFIGLALSPNVRFESGCLLLMSYWLAAMLTFIRTISIKVFQISYFGIGPTEIRIGLFLYVLSLVTVGRLPMHTRVGVLSLMDVLAIAIFAVVLVSFVIISFWEARRLAAVDRASGRSASQNRLELVKTVTESPVSLYK